MNKEAKTSFIEIISIIGAILIFIGILWNIADNWHIFPSFLKIAILLTSTSAALVTGVKLKENKHEKLGRSIILLGGLLYIASVFLIAQIYYTSSTLQGTAWLFLIALIGTATISYLLESKENIVTSFIVFLLWFTTQFLAITENYYDNFSIALLVIGFLVIGILFYALSLIHKNLNHNFSKLYKTWSVFYFLSIAYILSFQYLMLTLWEESIHLNKFTYFIMTLTIISISTLIYAASTALTKKNITKKEIAGFLIIILAFLILITLTSITTTSVGICHGKYCHEFETKENCINPNNINECDWNANNLNNYEYCSNINCHELKSKDTCHQKEICTWNNEFGDNGYCEYNYNYKQDIEDSCNIHDNNKNSCEAAKECTWNPSYQNAKNLPFSAWAIWITINIFFILFILTIIYYGQTQKNNTIINLAITFFILNIFTRYIGFIADFYDYTGLSLTFIIGGILLLFGSWIGTKWREKLINENKKK